MKQLIPFLILLSACNTKQNSVDLDNKKIVENFRRYLNVHLPQVVSSIDSITYSVQKFTEKDKIIDNATGALVAAIMWREYPNDAFRLVDHSNEYCTNKYIEYTNIYDSLKEKSASADSIKYTLYKVKIYGLFTKSDMVQNNFTHEIFMTKDYRFIEKNSILTSYPLPISVPGNKITVFENVPPEFH